MIQCDNCDRTTFRLLSVADGPSRECIFCGDTQRIYILKSEMSKPAQLRAALDVIMTADPDEVAELNLPLMADHLDAIMRVQAMLNERERDGN